MPPIIVRSGDFKPSDPFGLYRDRANPLDPNAPKPNAGPQLSAEELAQQDEIRRAEEANAQVDSAHQQLEAQSPGQYQVIDEAGYDAWRADWEARQPGWIEDTARILGGSLAKGTGAIVSGLGSAITGLTNATTTPVVNQLFGTNYGKANPVGAPAEWISTLGEKTQEGVSFATREAIANSTPGGDLLDPSSWTLGEAPSAVGYGALVLDVFGQMTPIIAAAVLTGGTSAAIVGGLQGGGAASQQAEAVIDQMAAEPGLLERESAYYREQIAAGVSHEQALGNTKAAAGQAAFWLTAPISGLGGFATSKIIDPATAILQGKNIIARISGRAALSGLEEGVQEAAESAATKAGINAGAGTDLALTEGTFGDFLLGALAGGAPGAVAGALSPGGDAAAAAPQMPGAQPNPAAGPTGANPAPVAPSPAAPPSGPLTRAREHGVANSPATGAGSQLVVNDPPLPGMGAGEGHGQTVTLSPNQTGIDPDMARVVMPDGTERVMGKRLLEDPQGIRLAPDPQAMAEAITVSNVGKGARPRAGQRAIVEAPDMPAFNGTIEQYVQSEGGTFEAIVVDDNGEVFQVPETAIRSLDLAPRDIQALEVEENPPVEREPVPEAPNTRKIHGASVVFPDETLAQISDLGRERAITRGLDRAMGSTLGRLQSPDMNGEKVRELADTLGVLPDRVNSLADDYWRAVDGHAKSADSALPQNMFPIDATTLAEWRAERAAADEKPAAGAPSAPTSAADADAAWWDALPPGARKAALASAGVKRSENSTWDKFTKPIKAKLAVVRSEFGAVDGARQRSQLLDAGIKAPPIDPAKLAEDELSWIEENAAGADTEVIAEMLARSRLASAQEKQSDPVDWSDEETKAYRAGNTRRFSELRGYTQDEIENHERYIELANGLIEKYGTDFVAALTLDEVAEAAPDLDVARDDADPEVKWRKEQETKLRALEDGKGPLTAEDEAEITRLVEALSDGQIYPDQADHVAESAITRARANRTSQLDQSANAAATSPENDLTEPSQAQKEAGNYKLGHHKVGGLDLSIENPAGSERKGVDRGGKPWSVRMESHYGYIKGTVGKDKDHIDVFVKPGTDALEDSAPVFVVDQVDPEGSFDEHKVMVGFNGEAEAREAYLENYTKGWKGLGNLGATTLGDFKQWLKVGQTSKPFSKSAPAATNLQEKRPIQENAAGTPPKPYDAAKELPAQVLRLLNVSGTGIVGRMQEMIALGSANAELLAAWDRSVGDHVTGMGGDRVTLQARVRKLEVVMPSADGAEVVKKTYAGGDLVKLIRGAVALAPQSEKVASNIDGVEPEGDDTSAPDRAVVAADPAHEADRQAMKNFKKGQRVSWTNPGTYTQADGSAREGLVQNGVVESVHSKELGTFTVKTDRGGSSMVPARMLRPEEAPSTTSKAQDDKTHPGLVVRKLSGGKETVLQPKGTTPPEKRLGKNRDGHPLFEDERGVRFYVEKGIRISETVTMKPGGGIAVTTDHRGEFLTEAERKPDRKDYAKLIADLENGIASWAAEGGNELLDGKLELAKRLQALTDEEWVKVEPYFHRDMEPGVTLDPAKGLAEIERQLTTGPGPQQLSKAENFAKNKLFTADKVAAAKARLKSKMNQLNSGPDPEVLVDGMTIAGAYIEAGVRDFADYAARMTADFGEGIKPFLLSFWEAVRHYPGLETGGMTPPAEAATMAAALNAAPEVPDVESADVQSGMEGPARARVGADDGEPDVRPQRQPSRANPVELEAGEPADVEAPTDGGRRRTARKGAAAEDVGGARPADLFGNAGDGRQGAGRARASDAGAGNGAAGTRADVSPIKAPESVSPANQGPGNFHISDPLKIVGGGQVARFEKNRAAIELLNTLRDEGRQATVQEQEVLAGYTGWGSFGQDLFQGTWAAGRPKQGWEARDKWLRDNLGQQEWESLQRSITNAHYTDPPTVMAMWDMVKRMGFSGGRVLEPSMGIGNFFGMMPLDIKTRSKLSGIELEQVTGDMAKLLYPDANVSITGYQASKTPDGFYDVVIGNWPFEDTVIADRRYNRFSPYLHDYFYLKALDQVRAGGLVVGITSKGTLDKKDSTIRTELAKKGELVAAFRLPSGAFEEYAGTKVVTDIIILRKRDQALGNAADAGWIKSVPYKTPSGGEVSVNEYFVANPSHVIGTIDFGHGTTFNRPGLIVNRPADMTEQLKRVTALVPEGAYRPDSRPAKQISYITNHTADREGALTKTKAGLFIVRGEHLAPAQEVAKYEVKDAKATADRVAQLERLIDMRKAYAELISAERSPDGSPEPARKTLKAQYDAFTKAHGTISDSFGLNYLGKIDDPFYPALAALEQRTDKGIKPAGILSQSTIRAPRSIANPSVSDAFVLARNTEINPSLKQIAEIAKRPETEVRAELIAKGAVFELPGGDVAPSDIYLSGNVREKMRQARAALDAGNAAMERNVAALEKVMPPDVPYYNIEVQMGASWVPTGTYAEYVAHMLNVPATEGIGVYYTAGRWRIALTDHLKSRPEARAGFGTEVYPFSKLLNAAISNQTVTIRKRDSDGNEFVDQDATAEANDKVANIRSSFGDWLWSDPSRRMELESEYNEVRNAFASPSFDGSFLSFEGMALSLGRGPFDLREHQANAIWRALVMRRSLNAHEVGTGKTFTMGGIAVESRRYGIAKKPLIFAHNANSKSVASEISQMYPAAKVLYIDNLAPAQIDIKMRQIANDDWDAVVVPHSLISRFALTEETLMSLAAEEIAALEAEAYEAAKDDGVVLTDAMLNDEDTLKKLRSPTAKDLVKMRNRIIESIKKQGQRASKEGAISFEDLGVDMVMVDEVHEFKKPPFSTRMRIKGLNTQSSDKSIALAFLTRYIRSQQNGGNVHLFTGTPVTNTLTEVFHMMRYMMAEEMADMSVDQWDGWFGSFAKEVQDVELNAAAEYEAVNRLAGFINVPELRRMIGQYMDVVFADDMPEMKPRRTASGKVLSDSSITEKERAELLNGRTENAMDRPYKKVIVETADLTPDQQAEFSRIQGYAQRWRNMTGKEKKDAMAIGAPESPIIYENLAAKASFDVRLMRGQELAGQEGRADDHRNSKASRAIKNLMEIYRSHPKATQVVFTNAGISTTGTRSVGAAGERSQERFKVFSTVGDIVSRLEQQGIPRSQIAVVDGSTSKDKRKEIADAMNRAEIRVVIGSTQSLGVGVNMQRNLRAMHHLDAPWMPGDLEQRNGRGLRQGNQWNTVLEYRYITDRIDGRRWQVLAIKQRFINAFLKSDDNTRIIEGDAASEEESDILTTFAEAAGDPRVLIREKLKKKIEQLMKRQRLHDNGIVDAVRTAKRLETRKGEIEANIKRMAPIADKVEALSKATAGDGFSMVVDGKIFDTRGDAREAIDANVEASGIGVGGEPRVIGSFGGYELQVRWPRQSASWTLGILVDDEFVEGKTGSLNSLEISLRKFRDAYNEMAPEVAEADRSITRLRSQSDEPFHQAADLARAEADFEALEADLAANPVPPPAWLRSGAPVDTEVMWKGEKKLVSGHRWNSGGWFVLTSTEDGPVEMPYLDVTDEQGMSLYDERTFAAPVVEKKENGPKAEAPAPKASRAKESRTPSVGARNTPDAVRRRLRASGLASMIDALEQSDRLRIVESKDVDANLGALQGYTDPDGTITLVADQIAGDPLAVLLHEAFHSGAAELLGLPAWRRMMLNLAGLYRQFENSSGNARKFFDAARARVSSAERSGGALTEPLRIEEFAAYAIEEQASAPAALSKWVDELVGTIKAWALKRFGRQLGAITPSQLKAIAKFALLESVGTPSSPTPGMASRRQSLADVGAKAKAAITRERIGQEIGGRLTDLKPAALATVPLNYFGELKRPGMIAVDQYLKVKRMMDAYRGNKHAAVDEVAQEWRKYARLGLGGADAQGQSRAAALADLMHETTLAGVDPSSTDEEMEKKAGYAALRARYLALPKSGQALYQKVRDTYADQADELDGILLDNVRKTQEIAFRRAEDKYRDKLAEIQASKSPAIDKSLARKEAEDTYRTEMGRAKYNMKARLTKLRMVFEASRVPAPYFPLARFGKYFVTVKDIEGNVLSFSKRETDAERQRLEADMRQAFPNATVESGLLVENSSNRDMMDPRIVAEIETLLGDAGVDAQVMDMIWQRYLETMPDLSARKRFIHRKGVAGFDGDALRTFANNQFHAAHQMARLKFGLELTELTNQATDQAKKADDQVRGMQLANELRKRHEWVMNPTGSKFAQGVTQMMFLWYLAATPAAAIINMSQTAMMGIPVLGARLGGIGKATVAIGKASADVMRGKGSARNANLSAEDRRALEAFYESGMIDRTQAHDLAGVGETGVAYSPWRHKVMSIVSWAYHNVEIWNREVTALAAYRMARDQGHHEGKAIDLAHELTWASHFDYSNSSRPRFMQGDVAKVVLTFQSHQVNMWYRLFRDIHQSVKGESAQARKEARYQLAGILGMMSLMGGMTGFFGYNVLVAIAGLAFDDDDDPRKFKDELEGHIVDLLGKDIGGMVLKGVPGHLTGIDLTSRLGMPDFFIRAPDSGAEGRDWFQELIIGSLGVFPSTVLNAVDGAGLVMQGDIMRGVEVLAPKAIKDLLQATRYANEGVLSRKGDVVLDRDQINALDVLVEALGFTPAKVAETYERMGALKDAEQSVLDERRALMNRFALAVVTGDSDAKRSAIEAIKAWNRKPYAKAVPITSDGLTQSLKSRARNSAKREDGVLIADPELGQLLRQLMPAHMY